VHLGASILLDDNGDTPKVLDVNLRRKWRTDHPRITRQSHAQANEEEKQQEIAA
jgi:hypothetical protein